MLKKLTLIRKIIFASVCIAFIASFICLCVKNESVKAVKENAVLSIWQIDSFEGGRGSRADYLKTVGKEFNNKENCYVNVVALSATAARLNLANGTVPDIISYGAGTYGIESYVKNFSLWCRGGYCLLTLDGNADFTDVTADNTVINGGKDNFASAAALFCGLRGAKVESPTSAYVKLINGDCKYLLGSQRDVFRLKTRAVAFAVKPVTEFNDLYQIVSVTASCKNADYAQRYVDFLLTKNSGLDKIGMLSDGVKLYDDEMATLENLVFDSKITYPISESMKAEIEKSILLGDINILKELLK